MSPAKPSRSTLAQPLSASACLQDGSLTLLFRIHLSQMPPFHPALSEDTEDLSDTHLAQLLAADARAASQRYSTQGLSALLGTRGTATPKVKLNTRFLKNLVRDADTHNDRLRRKEEGDWRERMKRLEGLKGQSGRDARDGREERRSRSEDGRERKRRKMNDLVEHVREQRPSRDHRQRKSRDKERSHRRSKRQKTSSETERESSRSRSPNRSNTRDQHMPRNPQSKQDHHDVDPANRPDDRRRSHRKHNRRRSPSPEIDPSWPTSEGAARENGNPNANGTSTNAPPSDVVTELKAHAEADSDWQKALEFIRSRAKMKLSNNGQSPPNGTRKGREEDAGKLKWSAQGEEREWDRGKDKMLE